MLTSTKLKRAATAAACASAAGMLRMSTKRLYICNSHKAYDIHAKDITIMISLSNQYNQNEHQAINKIIFPLQPVEKKEARRARYLDLLSIFQAIQKLPSAKP